MIERGGHVMFDKEMGNPGEAIGHRQCRYNPPPTPLRDRSSHEHPTDEGSDNVHHSRRGPAMRSHIDGPKLRKDHQRPLAIDNYLGGSYHNFELKSLAAKG